MVLTLAAAALGVILLGIAHEAGTLAIGRALGVRTRFAAAFPTLVAIPPDISRTRRAAVLAGGLAAAYLALVAIAFGYFIARGTPSGAGLVVDSVIAGFDAETKLVPGDRVVSVDHEPFDVDGDRSLVERVNARAGAPIVLGIVRDGAPREVTITPTHDRDRWLLGIKPRRVVDYRSNGVGDSLGLALRYPIDQAHAIVQQLAAADRPEVGGPVRMVEEFRANRDPYLPVQSALLTGTYFLLLLAGIDLVRGLVRPRR